MSSKEEFQKIQNEAVDTAKVRTMRVQNLLLEGAINALTFHINRLGNEAEMVESREASASVLLDKLVPDRSPAEGVGVSDFDVQELAEKMAIEMSKEL